MEIPLVDESDVKSRRSEISEIREKSRKRPEKPVRILRIKYHEKISLPFMEEGKLGHKDIFAVDRGLEDLLKALYHNTNIQGMIPPPGCIFVEKDDRIWSNDKFIFIEIGKDEFSILKRQLESPTTVCVLNKGELLIMEGKRSSLAVTFDIPRVWRVKDDKDKKYGKDKKIKKEMKI